MFLIVYYSELPSRTYKYFPCLSFYNDNTVICSDIAHFSYIREMRKEWKDLKIAL